MGLYHGTRESRHVTRLIISSPEIKMPTSIASSHTGDLGATVEETHAEDGASEGSMLVQAHNTYRRRHSLSIQTLKDLSCAGSLVSKRVPTAVDQLRKLRRAFNQLSIINAELKREVFTISCNNPLLIWRTSCLVWNISRGLRYVRPLGI